jgi:hypothetical protein
MKSRGCSVAFALVAISPILVTRVMAQRQQWTVAVDAGAGVFVPARDLGVIGVTSARFQSSPILGIGVELRPRVGIVSLRLSTQQSVRSGMRFRATSECQQGCVGPWSGDRGRFWGASADVLAHLSAGAVGLTVGLGGGLREYHSGSFDCTCTPAPPGYPDADPFQRDQTAAALHLTAGAGFRLGRVLIRAGAEDYVSHGPAHRTQHDLVISGSVAIPLRGERE